MDRSKYPDDWERIAREKKEAADWKCEKCNQAHGTENRRHVLTVHHLDRDPSNSKDENLAALCAVCHLQDEARLRREERQRTQCKLDL